jgi:hypothetical protein
MTISDKQIRMVILKIVRTVDEYMDNHDGQKEPEKLAVVMSAMTRIIASLAAHIGVPSEMVTDAIKAQMQAELESGENKDELH